MSAAPAPAKPHELEWVRPDWEALRSRPDRTRSALPTVRECLKASEDRISVFLGRGAAAAARADLRAALGGGDVPGVGAAAARLAGMGEGSTPAADDLLVGVMYGLFATTPAGEAAQRSAAIAAAAAPLTTRLSAQWLQRAAGGETIPTWSFFLAALADGDAATIRERAERVRALGHTSGQAALSGFLDTVELLGDRDA